LIVSLIGSFLLSADVGRVRTWIRNWVNRGSRDASDPRETICVFSSSFCIYFSRPSRDERLHQRWFAYFASRLMWRKIWMHRVLHLFRVTSRNKLSWLAVQLEMSEHTSR